MLTDPKLSADEYDLLTFLEQYYLTQQGLPSSSVLGSLGLDEVLYLGALKKPEFRDALEQRGVPSKIFAGVLPTTSDEKVSSWKDHSLSEEQLLCANAVLDSTDNRSRRKKLAELGISTQKYEQWMRDPVFSSYLRTRAEALLVDSAHESHLALVDRVKSGDVSAIKYYNELTGRYVQASSRNGSSTDVRMVLLRVIEVLQRHLEPETLAIVGHELLQLVEGGSSDTVVPVPTPARERVLPPELMPVSGSVLESRVVKQKVEGL